MNFYKHVGEVPPRAAKIARLRALHQELSASSLPAMLLVDKFKEAVLLTIEITLEGEQHGKVD